MEKKIIKRNRVLIITYYNYPCKEQMLENVFAKELGKKHDVAIVFNGIKNKKKYLWHNSNIFLVKKLEESNFRNKIINKLIEINKPFNILYYIYKKKFKIIVFRDLPGQVIIFNLLKKLFKLKIFYQSTAPLGDINIVYGNGKKSIDKYWYIITGQFFNILEKKALKKADIIFTISEYQKLKLEKIYKKKLIVPITMGIDEEWINYNSIKKHYLEKIKQENKIITYFGTLNSTRNPKIIIRIFSEVKKQYEKCKLILMGSANKKYEIESLKNLTKKLYLQNDVIFTGSLDRITLKSYLQYCDISLSAIPPINIYQLSSPTKLYESLGNCIPVVANKGIIEHEKVINQSRGGILVDYNIEDFSKAIIKLLRNDILRKKMGKNGKKYVLKKYNYRLIARSIEKYFY